MSKYHTEVELLFGLDAKYTCFGKKGCSHGMYSGGGYDYYVYGIKGLFNLTIHKSWGEMA